MSSFVSFEVSSPSTFSVRLHLADADAARHDGLPAEFPVSPTECLVTPPPVRGARYFRLSVRLLQNYSLRPIFTQLFE